MMNNTSRIFPADWVEGIRHSDSQNFILMAGPCVVEGRDITLKIAAHLAELSEKYTIPYVFKASYKKANRSRLDSFTGIGDEEALKVLAEVKSEFNVPVITDIHSPEEARWAAEVVDVLQIPAFLCRQTELLLGAALTGKTVAIKKGQFLSPEGMQFAIEKIRSSGNSRIILTERGTTFGYQDLIVDFRSIPIMKGFGVPVILDVTHALQQPNQGIGVTGGQPEHIETLARAGVAAGVDGIFMETHPNPSKALSDGANMLALDSMEDIVKRLIKLREIVFNMYL